MFVLWLATLLAVYSADHIDSDEGGRLRCGDITDVEELCKHKNQCLPVMPDLPKLCRSFKKERHGVDEFVEIIDTRRSDTHIIEMLKSAVAYHDASPPVIIQGPKNLTVTPGSEYQLECKAEGAPTPKLTITRRSEASLKKVKSRSNDLDIQLSAAHVIHKNERVQNNDEGWYRCVAANSRGVVYADAFLRVYDLCQDIVCTGGKVCVPDNEAATASCVCPECMDVSFKPICGTDCVTHFNYCQLELKNCIYGTNYSRFLSGAFCPDFTPPEFIETPPKTVDVIEGKAFTLTCKAVPAGDSPGPPPIISWYLADYEPATPTDPTSTEGPTEYEPNYGAGKLGDGETIKLRFTDDNSVFCVAHQCKHGQSIPIDIVSEQTNINVAPGEYNSWSGSSCQVFGDPHIVTFDDAFYEFEGRCEYIIAMDCEDRKWSVYGSFETCSTHGRGSCLSSVTLYYNGDIHIELLRGMIVNNGGERVEVAASGPTELKGKDGTIVLLYYQEGWLVVKFNEDLVANSHSELRWDGLLSVQILVGHDTPPTCGLCGNANKDATDDSRMRRTGDLSSSVEKFGDSWKVDRRNKCSLAADRAKWEWEKEFSDRRDQAVRVCTKVFDAPQLLECANGLGFGDQVNPAPYKDACIADYMRSDFLPDEISGQNMACVAAMNYAERCGNANNHNHLWREGSGCAAETEELAEFQTFIGQFDCNF